MDFPKIPYPMSESVFAAVSENGEALRRLHLMEDAAIGDTPFSFRGQGNSVVDKARFEVDRIWINESQYFEGVPQIAWELAVGGYFPTQKWLKDRKGRTLNWSEIRHYQKIIKILVETHRIMGQIELPI